MKWVMLLLGHTVFTLAKATRRERDIKRERYREKEQLIDKVAKRQGERQKARFKERRRD